MADKTANRFVQSIVVIVGLICIAIIFIVDKLGAILQVSKFLKQDKVFGSCKHGDKSSVHIQSEEFPH
jgi:hypothetical protein